MDHLLVRVTGESLDQKTSQTAANRNVTSRAIDFLLYRPLLMETDILINQYERRIGMFETATVALACRSLAPASPTPAIERKRLESLKQEVDLDDLVERAEETTETIEVAEGVEP